MRTFVATGQAMSVGCSKPYLVNWDYLRLVSAVVKSVEKVVHL